MDLPNTYDKYFDVDECVFPNFYCDTVNTSNYCDPETEHQWLIDFYHATNGDEWYNNTNWLNENVSHCEWYGVRCCDKIVQYNHTSNSTYHTLLNKSCINTIYLNGNGINGTFPNYWFESSIFTIFSSKGEYEYERRIGLKGNMPEFKYHLPNMAYIHLPSNGLTGTIPDFGNAHCTLVYDLYFNYLNSTIPNWENDIYIAGMILDRNLDIYGTIPNWDEWISPFKIKLNEGGTLRIDSPEYHFKEYYSLTGTIPNFNQYMCPILYELNLSYNHLFGSLPQTQQSCLLCLLKKYGR